MDRANAVLNSLRQINRNMKDGFFDTCALLMEAHDGAYHTCWDYPRFGDWVESTGLDISARQAYYYLTIGKKAADLQISREELLNANISQLKKIFELDPGTHATEMRQLLASADQMTLKETEDAVVELRAAKTGEAPARHMTFKFEDTIRDTVKEAFELARRIYGDTLNVAGEAADISDSKCMELICVEFLNGASNQPEQQ